MWALVFSAPILFGICFALEHRPIAVLVAALTIWIVYYLRLILCRQPHDIPIAVVRLITGISQSDMLLIISAITLLSHPAPV